MKRAVSLAVLLLAACTSPRAVTPAAPPPEQVPARAAHPAPRPPAAPSVVAAVPAPAPMRYLKGQTHVHTDRSYDAHTPPNRVVEFYREHGYDFVALTDHNRVTVVEPPRGILLIPGVELTQNSEVCEPKPSPGYRCLFHLTGLFVDPSRDRAHGDKIALPFHPGRLDAYRAELDVVKSLGGVAVLNHPLFHFAADAHLVTELVHEGVRFLELVNASLDDQHPGGRADAETRAEALWDEVLSGGTLVYAVASDDAHHFDDAKDRARQGKFAYVGDRAFIMVEAEKKADSIRSAMLSGHYYASTGVLLDRLLTPADGHLVIHVAARPGERYLTRFVGRNGRELSRAEGDDAEFRPAGDEGYVRAVVESTSGAKAWTQPVMLRAATK